MTHKKLFWDLETDGLLRELTRIWVMAIGDSETGEIVTYTDHDPNHPSLAEGISRMHAHAAAGGEFIGHNTIGFDRKALFKVTGWLMPLKLCKDTMVMARLRNPERVNHKLESWGIELGILKDLYDGGWDEYSEAMRSYNAQDIVVTKALYERVKVVETWGSSCELEHSVCYLIDLQMENGFMLDIRAAMLLAAEIEQERQRLGADLQRMFPPIYVGVETKRPKRTQKRKVLCDWGTYVAEYTQDAEFTSIALQEFNPGSEYHVSRRLFDRYGWKAPLTDKGNPNITEAVLKKLDYPETETLIRFGREDKRWTQLAKPKKKDGTGGGWIHHADDEDRVHGYVNSNGAVTGRMTHNRPNSANIDKDASMRALWISKIGWVLVGCDAEGLELRMLAHYLAKYDGGELTRQLLEGDKSLGTDAHSVNRKNTDLFSRDGAKTLLYGSLYGAGDEKAGLIWIADWRSSGKPLAEWPTWALTAKGKLRPAAQIGKEVKARLIDGIKGFAKLIKDVKAKAKAQGWIRGLDGRKVKVRSEHAALNTLLQSSGAIVMKQALVIYHDVITDEHGLVHGIDFGYCANVHDEVQQEAKPEHGHLIGKTFKDAITAAGDHFGVRCRLDGAYDIGKNWHETH
ncbi:DNA polymerase [Rhizobacter sp. Root1221]|uniref:DNA polymerase n=1 Tax=Rhizobacter sp. Root1221 TaxID=1736433 RepID=UPI0007017D9C|nr:DNA polymerase [Rhizobacter sp. Root1221]KQV99980.1 hypothetical protein ASC87_19970 [Rhizobacter sp. Root1221]